MGILNKDASIKRNFVDDLGIVFNIGGWQVGLKDIHCVAITLAYIDELYLRNKETQQILWVTKNMLCNASLCYN